MNGIPCQDLLSIIVMAIKLKIMTKEDHIKNETLFFLLSKICILLDLFFILMGYLFWYTTYRRKTPEMGWKILSYTFLSMSTVIYDQYHQRKIIVKFREIAMSPEKLQTFLVNVQLN